MANQISKTAFLFTKLAYQSKLLLIILIVLLLPVLIIYGAFLERTPVHLNQDELGFSLNAYSIAKTGFDESGRFFPLYFWHLGVMWSTPIIVYLTAVVLKTIPLSETAIRVPSVIVSLLDIILVSLLVRRIFNSKKLAVLAGFLLATTPVHFIHSRLLLDNLFIVPFTAGWLLFLYLYKERGNIWFLGAASFLLGLGIHSYHSAKIMMPLYLLFTFFTIWPQIKKYPKLAAMIIVSFVIPLLPVIPWISKYPDTFVDQVRYTQLYDTTLNPVSGILTLLTPESLIRRFFVFIAYFDPYFLFFRGDESLIHSTWRTGVFLLPLAIFIPLGVYSLLKKDRSRFGVVLVLGFLTAPLAAAVAGDHYRISRALTMLPFAMVLATYGIRLLLSSKRQVLRLAAIFLLFAVPIQFSYFVYDYFKDYRNRSYAWFRYNIPSALESIIKQDEKLSASGVYLDSRIDFIDRYWRFFLLKHKKGDLSEKTYYFEPDEIDLETVPKNSLILYHFDHIDGLKDKIGPFQKVENIIEPDGTGRFYLYRN